MKTLAELLTTRQLQVCELVSLGWTNQEIAKELGIAYSTVDALITRIFDRTGASNRAMIAGRYARETPGPLPSNS